MLLLYLLLRRSSNFKTLQMRRYIYEYRNASYTISPENSCMQHILYDIIFLAQRLLRRRL